jgi:acetone carboxylase gamma subunit
MNNRISPTLSWKSNGQGKLICCTRCGHSLATVGQEPHWKHAANLAETPVVSLPGWSSSVHEKLLLREFSCVGCGSLLDSETALPEDPFLYDTVSV